MSLKPPSSPTGLIISQDTCGKAKSDVAIASAHRRHPSSCGKADAAATEGRLIIESCSWRTMMSRPSFAPASARLKLVMYSASQSAYGMCTLHHRASCWISKLDVAMRAYPHVAHDVNLCFQVRERLEQSNEPHLAPYPGFQSIN